LVAAAQCLEARGQRREGEAGRQRALRLKDPTRDDDAAVRAKQQKRNLMCVDEVASDKMSM
jgi:hypothetical protein